MQNKALIAFQIIAFLFSPKSVFAISKIELILKDETISRKHAKIRPEKEGYVLYDMLSRNGTYVNKKKIKGYVLKNGDLISIGFIHTLIFNEEEKGRK